MIMLDWAAEGAGKPPPFTDFTLVEAVAGVGPLGNGEVPSDAGADRTWTLIKRCSSRASVKNFA